MKKWDVVLLNFPFSNQQATKVRPAVVISHDEYHQQGYDVCVILITSNTTRNSLHDIIIANSHPEFPQTGLRKDSAIRVSKIVTLEKKVIQHTLGTLGKTLISEVERELRAFLKLPPYQEQLPPPSAKSLPTTPA
jgi:mRNA interferase MazF